MSPALAAAPYPSSSNSLSSSSIGGRRRPADHQGGSVGLYVDDLYISRAMADVQRYRAHRSAARSTGAYGRNDGRRGQHRPPSRPANGASRNSSRSATGVHQPGWSTCRGREHLRQAVLRRRSATTVEHPGVAHYSASDERGGRSRCTGTQATHSTDYAYEGDADTTPIYQNALNLDLIPGYNLDREKTYRAIGTESNSSTTSTR